MSISAKFLTQFLPLKDWFIFSTWVSVSKSFSSTMQPTCVTSIPFAASTLLPLKPIYTVTDGGSKGMLPFTSCKASLWEANLTHIQSHIQKSNFWDAHPPFLIISLGWEWGHLTSFNSITNEWCAYLSKQHYTIQLPFLPISHFVYF